MSRIVSWAGLEEEREQIRAAAREVLAKDALVRARMRSSVATGLVCEAMRDPRLAASPEVAEAAKANDALYALHSALVLERGVEFDLVRGEWAPILNPTQEERELCRRLVENARHRVAARRKRKKA